MIQEISVGKALELNYPLLDVRSPKEYQKGHIPGAENVPLFSDDERAKIGTTYKQKSKKEAVDLGYQFVAPKLQHFIDQASMLAPDGIVSVHCWRGGMRSKAFAKHLSENGFEKVNVITGGYKAYRNHILDKLSCPGQLKILGGYTGSGKTPILNVFERRGKQVIDLEGLARHKGSAFGGLGEDEFPTTQQFENDLFHKWSTLDKNRPIWLEDEGHNIGPVRIPIDFYRAMKESYLYFIDIPKEERAKYLAEEYGKFKNYELKAAIQRISKRLGGEREQKAIEYLREEKYVEIALIALKYYDKFYFKGLKKRKKGNVCTIRLQGVHHEQNAEKILKTIRDE
ncbi:MAG: tRNA 2-selenouridine(34) synthase MnmH [Bacteroidetes bacterium]|nr:tRNA 2-selenouridine(34) synthase MnmH [Bacteroidota bacterium]